MGIWKRRSHGSPGIGVETPQFLSSLCTERRRKSGRGKPETNWPTCPVILYPSSRSLSHTGLYQAAERISPRSPTAQDERKGDGERDLRGKWNCVFLVCCCVAIFPIYIKVWNLVRMKRSSWLRNGIERYDRTTGAGRTRKTLGTCKKCFHIFVYVPSHFCFSFRFLNMKFAPFLVMFHYSFFKFSKKGSKCLVQKFSG